MHVFIYVRQTYGFAGTNIPVEAFLVVEKKSAALGDPHRGWEEVRCFSQKFAEDLGWICGLM